MSKLTYADADGVPYSRIIRRRVADLEFLAKLRVATREELERMAADHRRGPEWKRVAIARRLR